MMELHKLSQKEGVKLPLLLKIGATLAIGWGVAEILARIV